MSEKMHQFHFSHMGNKITLAQGYFWWKSMDMVCDLPHIMKEKSTKNKQTTHQISLQKHWHVAIYFFPLLCISSTILVRTLCNCFVSVVTGGRFFTSIFVGRSFGSSSCSTNIDHICLFDQDYRATATNYAFFVRPQCWVSIYLAVVAHHS